MAGKYQSCREPVMNQTNKSFSFDLWEIVTEMHTWHRIDQITNLSILLVALSFLCEIWQCPEKNCECSSSPVFQIQISTDSGVHNRGLHSHRNADIYEIRPIQGSTPICILSKIKIKVLYRCQLIKKTLYANQLELELFNTTVDVVVTCHWTRLKGSSNGRHIAKMVPNQ